MQRKLFPGLSCLAAAALLLTCTPQPPPRPGGDTHLSGIVHDSVTGDRIPEVVIRFGELSAQSGGDGSFSLELGNGGEVLVADWLVFKAGYQFIYADRVSIDSGRDWQLEVPLRKSDPSLYPTVSSLQGDLSLADGSPLPDGTPLWLGIFGRDGTYSYYPGATSLSRYSIATVQDSDDCLVLLRADPGAGNDFVVMAQGVDLSSPVELDFREPAEGFATVQVAASREGNRGSCVFSTPYGLIPGLFKDADGSPRIRDAWEFSSSAPEEVSVYNPFNWQQVFWVQTEEDGAFEDLPEHCKRFMSSSALGAFSGSVSLPAADRSLGPDRGADPASLELNGPRLTLDPVEGAGLYSFSIEEQSGGGNQLGSVLSFDSSVMLPEVIGSALGGRSIRLRFSVMDSHLAALGLELLGGGGGFPANLEVGMVEGSEAAPYARLIEVPEPGGVIVGIE